MNDILDKAKELGIAIANSEQIQIYSDIEKKLLKRDLLTTFMTYEQAKSVVINDKLPIETRKKASIIIEQHKETMENDVDIIAFRKAELKIQDLKSQITDTILHFGGIELAAKNCSSCSGCRK